MPDSHIDIFAKLAGKAWAKQQAEKQAAGWWPFGDQQTPTQLPKPITPPAAAPMAPPAASVAAPKLLEPPRVALRDGVYRPPQGSPAPAPIKVPAVPGQNMFDQVGRLQHGTGRWLNRMYTPGAGVAGLWDATTGKPYNDQFARGNAHELIQQHVAQNNATPAYQQSLAQRFQTLGQNPREAYSLQKVPVAAGGNKQDRVSETPRDIVKKHMTLSQPVPPSGQPIAPPIPEAAQKNLQAINNMDPNLTGLHELEHVNQQGYKVPEQYELPTRTNSISGQRSLGNEEIETRGVPLPQYQAEPAAVMAELVHGADAARTATGSPVPGNVALTPQYQPKLDWLRQQAQQHGVLSGEHTVQEQLNTPAGQAWLRMQYDQLAPPQGVLYNKYMQENARKLQHSFQDAKELGGTSPNLPAYMQQDLPKYLTKQNNAIDTSIDIFAKLAGKAWAKQQAEKQADLLPGIQLQEHQQRIADRVAGPNPRMLVYHGLGSGKSLSALAAAEAAQKLDGGNYGIVAPASLKNNFQKEIKKFTTATPGSSPEVMSYTGLGMGKQFQDQPETLIMDEAARLRNPDSAMTQAAVQAAARAKRVMLLTGTPITNEPKDLASLISLLNGKQLSPEEFDKQYVGEETVKPNWSGWFQGAKPGVRPVMRNGPKLRSLLEGHVDYQPSKTPEGVNVNEQTIRVPLSPEQDKIQKAIRTKVPPGFLWKIDHEFPMSRQELAKLNSFMTGFRQVGLSTQPFRADKSPLKAFQQSSKMQEAFKNLKTTLDSDPRKKAIIYSNFVDAGLNPYSAGLTQAGISHGMFTGSESVKNRQAAVDAYNQNKLRALLIGPAGAEGISTKGTSLIQLMDPHWNEARSQQAQGRGLRFDSHTDLPEELKNVAVQRYLSSSEDPSYLGKLMGYKRERTGDEVLSRLTAEKERLNEQFRQILRDAGTKTSAADICQVSREQLNSANNPRVTNLITTGPAMSSLENMSNMSIAEKCAYITKTAGAGAAIMGGVGGLVPGAVAGAGAGGLYGLASGAYQAEKGKKLRGALTGLGRGLVGGGLLGGGIGAGAGAGAGAMVPGGLFGGLRAVADPIGTASRVALGGVGGAALGGYFGNKSRKATLGEPKKDEEQSKKKDDVEEKEEKETSEEEANKKSSAVSTSNPRVTNLITTGPAMSSLENMSIAEKCAYITKAADLTGLAAGAGVFGGLGAGVGAAGGGLYGLASGAYQGGKGHRISGALRGAGRGIVGGGLIGGAAGAGLGGGILSQMPMAEIMQKARERRHMNNFEGGFGAGQDAAREQMLEQGPNKVNLMRALGLGAAAGGGYLGHKAFKGMAGDFHKKPPVNDVEEKETSEEEANKNAGLQDAIDAGGLQRHSLSPAAFGGVLGAGLGGVGGLIGPGHEMTYDDTGKVTGMRRRSRLMGALRGALATGALGAGMGALGGISAGNMMPPNFNIGGKKQAGEKQANYTALENIATQALLGGGAGAAVGGLGGAIMGGKGNRLRGALRGAGAGGLIGAGAGAGYGFMGTPDPYQLQGAAADNEYTSAHYHDLQQKLNERPSGNLSADSNLFYHLNQLRDDATRNIRRLPYELAEERAPAGALAGGLLGLGGAAGAGLLSNKKKKDENDEKAAHLRNFGAMIAMGYGR